MSRFPVLSLLLIGLAASPGVPAEPEAIAPAGHVVRVYYFHTTQRCASCKKIEAYSEEAVREGFARELGAGALEWKSLNLDDAANRHFVEDYQLYTKSLVVVDLRNGKEVRWKNLPRIWELLRDDVAFRQYVKREVHEYLEAAR
jgi:hypothetical protein